MVNMNNLLFKNNMKEGGALNLNTVIDVRVGMEYLKNC